MNWQKCEVLAVIPWKVSLVTPGRTNKDLEKWLCFVGTIRGLSKMGIPQIECVTIRLALCQTRKRTHQPDMETETATWPLWCKAWISAESIEMILQEKHTQNSIKHCCFKVKEIKPTERIPQHTILFISLTRNQSAINPWFPSYKPIETYRRSHSCW